MGREPIHQLTRSKWWRGLVHQQAAGVVLVAVPAAEVVGAVARVEQPLEVDRADLADRAGAQQGVQLAVDRVVAVVEADGDRPPVRSWAAKMRRQPSGRWSSAFP